MNIGSVFNLLDDNDSEFRHFMARKATIMTNMTHLAAKKFENDEIKQKELINKVEAALEKEEAAYKSMRKTIKMNVRRQTLARKDITEE